MKKSDYKSCLGVTNIIRPEKKKGFVPEKTNINLMINDDQAKRKVDEQQIKNKLKNKLKTNPKRRYILHKKIFI